MHDITPGQRWISDTELDMGLGVVLAVEHRTISIAFPATGEQRTYARQSAPLTRVAFGPGDVIQNQQGESLQVRAVETVEGLLFYRGVTHHGEGTVWSEGQLDHHLQLNRPRERLLAGQLDTPKWFELRYQTLRHSNRLAHSDLYGLIGARTSLIPHQLFIAHEVARRYAPRVLLADEVGLGKTIEAGLILHQQLLTERAQRVLIVVPEALVHQWLVEMLRRFNVRFSVFDEERCRGIEETNSGEATGDNPFESEQLILCSLDFLTQNSQRSQQALSCQWDFLVVDEAHHLQWSPNHSSTEYQFIESMAQQTKGVLLLTATPEQLGKESHFARLRLLDPDRFPDFDAFVEEEVHYQPVAEAVKELLQARQTPLAQRTLVTLRETLSEKENHALVDALKHDDTEIAAQARRQLIQALLDRHGTGRVLFRNTRATVKGFPERRLRPYPLPLPTEYAEAYIRYRQEGGQATPETARQLLCPEQLQETAASQWTRFDARIPWLLDTLQALKPEKVLLIAAHRQTAMDIAQAIKARSGAHVPVFHENLSIIERDRAAAYFADMEAGGQVLICSEIGSEGRNFQFAHHLVLFDLPLNPDLLEQRIGRLDRIGQNETIQIHVPYFEHSPQELMFQWYQQGLAAFEHASPAAAGVFSHLQQELIQFLATDQELKEQAAFIERTHTLANALNEQLHNGRDILLEYNACIPEVSRCLHERARKADEDHSIEDYLDTVFDCFDVDSEIHSNGCFILKPGEHMHTYFPGLDTEGMKVTFQRHLALANEDIHFITWEHPLARGAVDMVLNNETGNTALGAIKHPDLQAGTMLLECVYLLEPMAQPRLQSQRYLPPTTIHLVVDQAGKRLGQGLRHEIINSLLIPVDADTAKAVVRTQTQEIKALLGLAEQQADAQRPQLLEQAQRTALSIIDPEIERLRALRVHNPNVREEEIEFFEQQREAVKAALDSAKVRLEAVRLIIAT